MSLFVIRSYGCGDRHTTVVRVHLDSKYVRKWELSHMAVLLCDPHRVKIVNPPQLSKSGVTPTGDTVLGVFRGYKTADYSFQWRG